MATMRPVLSQLNVVARDFNATLTFYRRLGVEVPDGSSSPEGVRHADAVWRKPGGSSRVLLGFSVPTREEVDRLYQELTAARYKGRQPPYDAFWGARYAVVADPDGNDVGIMSPLDESRQSWPPKNSPAS